MARCQNMCSHCARYGITCSLYPVDTTVHIVHHFVNMFVCQALVSNPSVAPQGTAILSLHSKTPTQPDSHYIRYMAASVLKSTTLSTPEGHWLTCAW